MPIKPRSVVSLAPDLYSELVLRASDEGMGFQAFVNMLLQEWIAHHKRLTPTEVAAGVTNLDEATLG